MAALAEKGCSNLSLKLVYSFLRSRKMCIKNGNDYSNTRSVKGGSPQGTKLGNFLFCTTLDNIEDQKDDTIREEETRAEVEEDYLSDENVSAVPDHYNRNDLTLPGLNTLISANFYEESAGTRNKKNVVRDTVLEESYGLDGRVLKNWTLNI